jgi:hypothetical protein
MKAEIVVASLAVACGVGAAVLCLISTRKHGSPNPIIWLCGIAALGILSVLMVARSWTGPHPHIARHPPVPPSRLEVGNVASNLVTARQIVNDMRAGVDGLVGTDVTRAQPAAWVKEDLQALDAILSEEERSRVGQQWLMWMLTRRDLPASKPGPVLRCIVVREDDAIVLQFLNVVDQGNAPEHEWFQVEPAGTKMVITAVEFSEPSVNHWSREPEAQRP